MTALNGQSEALFQRVVDSLRERFVVIDKNFKILIVNDSALPNHLSKSDTLDHKLFDIYPNLAEQGFKHLIDEVFHTGKPHIELYVRHTTIDSYTGYHHRKILPIMNGTQVDHVIIVVENVHEERMAREYASHVESTYQTLIETLQIVSFELDAVGKFVHVSGAVMPVLGYTVGELIGQSFTKLIHREDVRQMWNIYWQIVNQGRKFGVCENRFQKKHGAYIHMRWSIHPLFNESGTIVGCRGVGEDITENAQRLSELKDRAITYQQIFQVAPTPLMLIVNGKIRASNRAALRLAFEPTNHAIDHEFVSIVTVDQRERAQEYLKNVEQYGRSISDTVLQVGEKTIPCKLTSIRTRNGIVVAFEQQRA